MSDNEEDNRDSNYKQVAIDDTIEGWESGSGQQPQKSNMIVSQVL